MAGSSTSPLAVDDNTPFSTLLTGCTIRARVAFVLAIAEAARRAIDAPPDVAERLRAALDLAWRWEQVGDTSGQALYETLATEDDVGLAIDESSAPQAQKPAWGAIISAIAYVAWHAFAQAGAKHMPETIGEVSEEVIDDIVDLARRTPGLEPHLPDRLAAFCLGHYASADRSTLGEPIRREAILQAGDAA